MMREEILADVRADVDRLGELWRKIDWLYENAVCNLDALEIADTEDGDTESDYIFAISNDIWQAMDECVAFDTHFRGKYGEEKSEETVYVEKNFDAADYIESAIGELEEASARLARSGR